MKNPNWQPIHTALINPFRPEDYTVKITANRRRWIHVFPVDREGRAKLAHHFVFGKSVKSILQIVEPPPDPRPGNSTHNSPAHRPTSPQSPPMDFHDPNNANKVTGRGAKGITTVWAWGSTGEEKWNPDMEIGMDWKSLVRSCLLPITTDFFPDSPSMAEYVLSEHKVEVETEEIRKWIPLDRRSHVTDADLLELLFEQLICQRLQRGYQIVLLEDEIIAASTDKLVPNMARRSMPNFLKQCVLSFNHIYHRIMIVHEHSQFLMLQHFAPKSMKGIERGRIRGRKEERLQTYNYMFQVPDDYNYTASKTK